MKKCYLFLVAAMLLLPIANTVAQTSHLGLGIELIAPITPYSKGYGAGYGVSAMYRNFRMTRSFMFDAAVGFSRTSAKNDFISFVDEYGDPVTYPTYTLGSYFWRVGFAWALIPNASPYTQPYLGFDFGSAFNTEDNQISSGAYMGGLRAGMMTYLNERFLFGFEMKYNGIMSPNARRDSYVTSIADFYYHQMTFQLSSTIRLGR